MFYPPMAGYLVITAISVFLIIAERRQAIRKNSVIGIRTRHTLASDAAWEAGHRAGAPYLWAMAIISTGTPWHCYASNSRAPRRQATYCPCSAGRSSSSAPALRPKRQIRQPGQLGTDARKALRPALLLPRFY